MAADIQPLLFVLCSDPNTFSEHIYQFEQHQAHHCGVNKRGKNTDHLYAQLLTYGGVIASESGAAENAQIGRSEDTRQKRTQNTADTVNREHVE